MAKSKKISRRNFLGRAAYAGSGLVLTVYLPAIVTEATINKKDPAVFAPNAFLQIGDDNSIQIILSKIEMGQGIWTTLPMLLAEELDCDWTKINVRHRGAGKGDDFLESPYVQSTGGSDSTRSEFDRWRKAGAVARTMLVQAAAARWKVGTDLCKTANGFVLFEQQKWSYGELAKEAAKLPIPEVSLRLPKEWKIIGKSKNRLDAPEKVNGQATYGMDVKIEGMLTAVVAHPPQFRLKAISFDAIETKKIAAVRNVIAISTGVAVVADHFWAAKTGRDSLKIRWQEPSSEPTDTKELFTQYQMLANEAGKLAVAKGDVSSTLSGQKLIAEISFPYLAHAPMEPLNCTVNITADGCEVWCGTQWPLLHQKRVADMLGLSVEKVIFHTPHLGGSFGRRGSFYSEWIVEAVEIAKAVGKPVKLIWTREDDITGGYYRPAYLHRVTIGIDANGFPKAWKHRVVGQSLFSGTPLEKDIVTNEIDWSSLGGVAGSPYLNNIPHLIELHTTSNEVPVLPWRSVSHTHTAFVMETLIDELAFLASIDPLVYRLKLLADQPRIIEVLHRAAEEAGWGQPLPNERFRGLAVHVAMGSIVAQVVEISVDGKELTIHRVVCIIDCGLAVNPDGIKAQIEGGIIYGLTAALYGEVSLTKGKVEQRNFHNYRMLRLGECPEISVHIIASNAGMGGVGEPGVPPIAPALANALFAATGKRHRSLPLKL